MADLKDDDVAKKRCFIIFIIIVFFGFVCGLFSVTVRVGDVCFLDDLFVAVALDLYLPQC